MIATSLSPAECGWETVSFASTLYLCPILDLLLEQIPNKWQPELRLGLQEALVNAAKHGNNLDPSKTVEVQFSVVNGEYWWVISDEGSGFTNGDDQETPNVSLPCDESESGRGMSLLHQIFDKVLWNNQGTEIRLCKQVDHPSKRPLLS